MSIVVDSVNSYFGEGDATSNAIIDNINQQIDNGTLTLDSFSKRPDSCIRAAMSDVYTPTPVNPDNAVIVIQNQMYVSDGKRYVKNVKTESTTTTDDTSSLDTDIMIKRLTDTQNNILIDLNGKVDVYKSSEQPTITRFSFWLDTTDDTLYKGIVADDGSVNWVEV